MMRLAIILILCLILCGCATGSITTSYDATGKAINCTASYGSLFKDVETVDFSACSGKAAVGSSSSASSAMSLVDLLKTVADAKKQGVIR